MRAAARLLDAHDLVEHARVPAREKGAAVDHHVDLVGPGVDGLADVCDLERGRRLSGREVGRDRSRRGRRCPRGASSRRARGTGRRRSAATDGMLGSTGSGRTAFAQSAATLPGVSAPSSVVRSIIRTASSSACSFDSRLIERFASSAARPSSATASIAPTRGSRGPLGSSKPRGRAGACAMVAV